MNNGISLEDAKALVSSDSLEKLKEVVYAKPVVDVKGKANCDILMTALCRAVTNGTIRQTALDDRIIKLLNASTSTLSAKKLTLILRQVRTIQPNMECIITLKSPGLQPETVAEWSYDGTEEVSFISIFDYVINKFDITPSMVRTKMGEMLKLTIVNNIAQLVAKYQNSTELERSVIPVSISTVSRLVNMCGYLLYAEFMEVY